MNARLGSQPALILVCLFSVPACSESRSADGSNGARGTASESVAAAGRTTESEPDSLAGVGETPVVPEDPSASTGTAPTFAFDPPRLEYLDLGLGEKVYYILRLETVGNPSFQGTRIVSSCDCVIASQLRDVDETGGFVDVEIDAFMIEDIDGVVSLLDADNKTLAEHVVVVNIAPRAFVQPRQIVLNSPYTQAFELTIGHAFLDSEEAPDFDYDFPEMDESKYMLEDFSVEPDVKEGHVIWRATVKIKRLQSAGPIEPGESITLRLVSPEAEKIVPISAAPPQEPN